jgi:integrase
MSRLDHWTSDELAAFLTAVRSARLEAAWHLTAAGLRAGELLALRWADVELDGARLEVRNAVTGVPFAAIKPSSTTRWARTVDLDSDLVAVLYEHRDRQRVERSEWGAQCRDRDLVLSQENGEAHHPRALPRAFARAVAEAGLRPIRLSAMRRCPAPVAAQQARAA